MTDLPKDIKVLLERAGVEEIPPFKPRSRMGWDEYFMRIAKLVSERSTCLSRQVGAVLVRGRRILATGYNGAPSGLDHCPFCVRRAIGVPRQHLLLRQWHLHGRPSRGGRGSPHVVRQP